MLPNCVFADKKRREGVGGSYVASASRTCGKAGGRGGTQKRCMSEDECSAEGRIRVTDGDGDITGRMDAVRLRRCNPIQEYFVPRTALRGFLPLQITEKRTHSSRGIRLKHMVR